LSTVLNIIVILANAQPGTFTPKWWTAAGKRHTMPKLIEMKKGESD